MNQLLSDEEIFNLGMLGPWPTVVFADGSCGIALDKTCANDFARAIEAVIMAKLEPIAFMYRDDFERCKNSETVATVYSVKVGSPDRGTSDVELFAAPQPANYEAGKPSNDATPSPQATQASASPQLVEQDSRPVTRKEHDVLIRAMHKRGRVITQDIPALSKLTAKAPQTADSRAEFEAFWSHNLIDCAADIEEAYIIWQAARGEK